MFRTIDKILVMCYKQHVAGIFFRVGLEILIFVDLFEIIKDYDMADNLLRKYLLGNKYFTELFMYKHKIPGLMISIPGILCFVMRI
jgi:hypothetical protein